jgi:PrtD family type I secretion system ABC transporter
LGVPSVKVAGLVVPEDFVAGLRGAKPHWTAALAFSLFINLLYLAPSIYMLQVYDRVVPTGGKLTLLFVTLALAVALATMALLDLVRNRLLIRASAELDAALSEKILMRSVAGHGSVAGAQAVRDFDTLRQIMASPTAAAILDVPWAPIYIFVAFLFHFWLGLFAIASIILLLGIAWWNQTATRGQLERSNQAITAAHGSQQSVAMHGQVIRALGMSRAMVTRQQMQRALALRDAIGAQMTGGKFTALSKFARMFVQSGALGLGALLAVAGEISTGSIIAASILLSRALQPAEGIISGWGNIGNAKGAASRLFDFYSRTGEAARIHTALPEPQGKLDIEQVGLRGSGGQPILLGVSISLRPGEILGVIGPSGAGKTSLAKLACGAIKPDAGTVRIDGAQLSDWDQDVLCRHIGYLPQEPSLFEGTIKDNISRFAAWHIDTEDEIDAKAVAAAKAAGVHELILRQPQGYDTMLGSLGAGLSAGQAQRVALARALYGDPTLLILDEPNSFLDAEGEAALAAAMVEARQRGAAIMAIAHRKAILSSADRLLVLEGGRPTLMGPAQDVTARMARPAALAEDAA